MDASNDDRWLHFDPGDAMNKSRPEHDLLVAVARRQLDSGDVDQLRRLAKLDIDWQYLLLTARQHGLIPLLHKHLNKAVSDLLPGKVRTKLKQESVANTQSILYLVGQAIKVDTLFRENGIPTAIFKGPILSQLVYDEMSLRQAGDIDVLIGREHFNRAKELLESLGFQMVPKLTSAQQAAHVAFHCEIQFVRDDWFTVVDLHWDLTPRSFVFGMSGEEVMSRLQTVSLAGSQIETFCAEDLLLYQAMHGAKHLWRWFEAISSVAELVKTIEPSAWSRVIDQAVKAHATKMLGLALRLAELIFEVTPPENVLLALDRNRVMAELAEKVRDELFTTQNRLSDSTDTNLYNLRIMDRRRDAVLSSLRAFFVPTLSDWTALSLPSSLHPLYYAIRPLRLSKVYSASLLRRLTNKPAS